MSNLTSVKTEEARGVRVSLLEQRALHAITTGTVWLDAATVDQRIGTTHIGQGTSHRLLERRRLFAIDRAGSHTFPAYAFTAAGKPIPALAVILAIFHGYSALRIAAWFESTSAALNGKRPRELLASNPRTVIGAARRHAHGPQHG